MLVMCHVPGDSTLQQFCCENLIFHKGIVSPNILAYLQLIRELLLLWFALSDVFRWEEHCVILTHDVTVPQTVWWNTSRCVRKYLQSGATVRQAQLIYYVFTGYMFRPMYRSSSGLYDKRVRKCYARWDRNMFTKIKYVEYIKCLC
jgi:hypothetical protein